MTTRILVVDDEPDMKSLFEQIFREEIKKGKYELLFAFDGEQALNLVQSKQVDIVCSDINMPRLNGLALLEKINRINPLIKTIMITAYGDMKNIRSSMNSGAFDFVTKPIDFEDLKKTLEKTRSFIDQYRETASFHHDLVSARVILDDILPSEQLATRSYRIRGKSIPARIVGGDFFDYYKLKTGDLAMVVADVCGKGFTAALFMYFARNLHRILSEDYLSPAQCLKALNEQISRLAKRNQFLTAAFAILNEEELFLASAGHCPVLVRRASGGDLEDYHSSGGPIGAFKSEEYNNHVIKLDKGDLVVFYTDGIPEAVNSEKQRFGMDAFKQVVQEHGELPIEQIETRVWDTIESFSGKILQSDDMSLMLLRKK